MEQQHQPGEIIAQKYRILGILGEGGIGITYAAKNLQTDERVALKVVYLRQLDNFKVLELFEREVQILAQLNHPGIPRYLDHFQVDERRNCFFYLVQQLAEGKSLAVLVENGWQPDKAEVQHIATQILDILVYLQQLTPPVIHRDIKPQNIIRQDNGQVFLVDFGAVQDVYHNTLTGGSTVVGTYGYMAPEQFRGKAVLATDLYALGATLIFLLTRKAPIDLPHRQLKIDFRSHTRLNKRFAKWLERMIEPAAEDRFLSAEEALAVLQGKQEFTRSATIRSGRPVESPIGLKNDGKRLVVEIPPVWLRSNHSRVFLLIPGVWHSIFLLMLWIVVASRYVLTQAGWVFLGIYGLLGLWVLGTFLLSATSRIRLVIDQQNFQLRRWLFGWCYQRVQGQTEEISQIELKGIGLSLNKAPITVCTLRSRLRKHRFGSFLTEQEKGWLVKEITDFLEKERMISQ